MVVFSMDRVIVFKEAGFMSLKGNRAVVFQGVFGGGGLGWVVVVVQGGLGCSCLRFRRFSLLLQMVRCCGFVRRLGMLYLKEVRAVVFHGFWEVVVV